MAKFTKQAICASFMKFLEEKPLEQITVKDIVDDCEINRKTFYYYYQDIYDLADDIFKTRMEQIKDEMPPDHYSLRDAIKVICEYLYTNKKIAFHVYKSLGYEKINDIFFEACMRYLPELVKKSEEDLTISADDTNLISIYISITISGVLTKWIRQGMETIPTDTVERLFEIMGGCSRLALENADRLNRQKNPGK